MTIPVRTVCIANARLKEGDSHDFEVLKKVELAEAEAWFVLKDPFGYKILLPENMYGHYGIEPGSIINCRVDKVNCSGRIFLEPRHPVYSEGQCYDFKVKGLASQNSNQDKSGIFLELTDVFNQDCRVLVASGNADKYLREGIARCRVERIKKARYYLRLEDELSIHAFYREGQYYPFFIEDYQNRHFILSDSNGQKHQLEASWYRHYGLKTGDSWEFKPIKTTSDGDLVLEPRHPVYEEGKIYEFEIKRIERLQFADGSEESIAIARDAFGEEAHLRLPEEWDLRIAENGKLRARVERIRKSRVYGELVI